MRLAVSEKVTSVHWKPLRLCTQRLYAIESLMTLMLINLNAVQKPGRLASFRPFLDKSLERGLQQRSISAARL